MQPIDMQDLARRTARKSKRDRERALLKALRDYQALSREARYSILAQMGFTDEELKAVPTLEAAMRGELDFADPGGRGPVPRFGRRSRPVAAGPSPFEWFCFGLLALVIVRCAAG